MHGVVDKAVGIVRVGMSLVYVIAHLSARIHGMLNIPRMPHEKKQFTVLVIPWS